MFERHCLPFSEYTDFNALWFSEGKTSSSGFEMQDNNKGSGIPLTF